MLSFPDFKQKQIIVALVSRGDKISFKNDNIIIKNDNLIKHQSSCYRLFSLFIIGHTSITTGLLQRAKRFGFSIVLLTHGLSPFGVWCSGVEGNVLLRKKQYEYSGLGIARHIVSNKINHQIETLSRSRNGGISGKECVVSLQEYKSSLNDSQLDLYSILGKEGVASRVYFRELFKEYNWKGRKPRVKHDIINLLLDIGYTQLFNIMDALLSLYGFDLYQGVYHKVFFQRKSLVCDIVEPFRSIVDRRIVKALRLGQVKENDFTFTHGQYRLLGKKAKPYVAWLLKNLLDYKHDMFLYVQAYYRAFVQEKDIRDYPFYSDKEVDSF